MPVQYHAPAGSGQARSAGGPGWPRQMCFELPRRDMRTERGVEHPLHRGRVNGVVCPIDSFRRRSPGQRRRLRQRAGRRRGSCGSPLRSRPRHLGTARPTADHRRALPRQRRLARPAVPGCGRPALPRAGRRSPVSPRGWPARLMPRPLRGLRRRRRLWRRAPGARRRNAPRPLTSPIVYFEAPDGLRSDDRVTAQHLFRSGRVGPANNSARHPRRGPARACVRPRRPAPSPRGPRSRAGSYRWPVREPQRTGGRCPATAAPGRAPVPGGRAPLRGAASYEGGEVMRCAGRRDRPCGATAGLASPAPAAPDTRRVGPRRRSSSCS